MLRQRPGATERRGRAARRPRKKPRADGRPIGRPSSSSRTPSAGTATTGPGSTRTATAASPRAGTLMAPGTASAPPGDTGSGASGDAAPAMLTAPGWGSPRPGSRAAPGSSRPRRSRLRTWRSRPAAAPPGRSWMPLAYSTSAWTSAGCGVSSGRTSATASATRRAAGWRRGSAKDPRGTRAAGGRRVRASSSVSPQTIFVELAATTIFVNSRIAEPVELEDHRLEVDRRNPQRNDDEVAARPRSRPGSRA